MKIVAFFPNSFRGDVLFSPKVLDYKKEHPDKFVWKVDRGAGATVYAEPRLDIDKLGEEMRMRQPEDKSRLYENRDAQESESSCWSRNQLDMIKNR